MATIKEGVESEIHNFLRSNKQWYAYVVEVYEKTINGDLCLEMNNGDKISFNDLFLQVDDRQYYDYISVGSLISQHMIGITLGDIEMLSINVGYEPSDDLKSDVNNDKLKSIAEPFKGVFVSGPGGSDGYISWSLDSNKSPNKNLEAFMGIDSVPLEVGFCEVLTLWNHLHRSRSWARWPYGSKNIYVAVRKQKVGV